MTTEVSWFKFKSREWLARTGGLNPSDKGILIDLLAIMHERGEPVPYNAAVLARRCRATPRSFSKAVECIIEAGLAHLEGGAIWSELMQVQIEFERKNSLSRKTAAEKRWKKTKENQYNADADAMLYESRDIDREGKAPQGPSPSSNTQPVYDETASSPAPEGAEDAPEPVAIYDEACDPLAFLRSITKPTAIRVSTIKAREKLLDFMASTVDRRDLAKSDLGDLLDRDMLTKGGAMAVVRDVKAQSGGETYAKKA